MNPIAKTSSDYEPFLTLYFEEEIMGESSFLTLQDCFPEPHQCEALELLSKIERQIAEAVRPLLKRHGLTPRPDAELHAIGFKDLDRYSAMTWRDFMENITVKFPEYIDEFAALARVAPDEDQEMLKPFTDHEIVGIQFAERELAGDKDSIAVLTKYLESFNS